MPPTSAAAPAAVGAHESLRYGGGGFGAAPLTSVIEVAPLLVAVVSSWAGGLRVPLLVAAVEPPPVVPVAVAIFAGAVTLGIANVSSVVRVASTLTSRF